MLLYPLCSHQTWVHPWSLSPLNLLQTGGFLPLFSATVSPTRVRTFSTGGYSHHENDVLGGVVADGELEKLDLIFVRRQRTQELCTDIGVPCDRQNWSPSNQIRFWFCGIFCDGWVGKNICHPGSVILSANGDIQIPERIERKKSSWVADIILCQEYLSFDLTTELGIYSVFWHSQQSSSPGNTKSRQSQHDVFMLWTKNDLKFLDFLHGHCVSEFDANLYQTDTTLYLTAAELKFRACFLSTHTILNRDQAHYTAHAP